MAGTRVRQPPAPSTQRTWPLGALSCGDPVRQARNPRPQLSPSPVRTVRWHGARAQHCALRPHNGARPSVEKKTPTHPTDSRTHTAHHMSRAQRVEQDRCTTRRGPEHPRPYTIAWLAHRAAGSCSP